MKRIQRFWPVFALAAVILTVLVLGRVQAQTSTIQGTFSFDPAVAKDGQAFYIHAAGAPANTQARIWVDNGDGKGFVDFGLWETTNSQGAIEVKRTMNCSAYATLVPGQSVAVGNRQITQRVYLEYVGKGVRSPEASHTKNCLVGANTPTAPDKPNTKMIYSTFPAGGDYTLPAGQGTLSASYNYSPVIPGLFFAENGSIGGGWLGLEIELSPYANYIYYNPSAFDGPDGRWDITDPMHPKTPDKLELTYGGSGGTGPLLASQWGHEQKSQGIAVAEMPDGEARVHNSIGLEKTNFDFDGTPVTSPVFGWDSAGQAFFGGQLAEDFKNTVINAGPGRNILGDANPSSGKFFLYLPDARSRGVAIPAARSIFVFDTTQLGPGGSKGDLLDKSGTISWTETQMNIVRIPGMDNHFLIARAAAGGKSNKATIHMAELDPDSGLPLRKKDQTVTLPIPDYVLQSIAGGDGVTYYTNPLFIQSATVGGKTYVFMVDSLADTNQNPSKTSQPDWWKTDTVIGIYKFDPAQLSLTKVSSLTVKNTVGSMSSGGFQVIADPNGQSYPLLAFLDFNLYEPRDENKEGNIDFYSTQKFLSGTSTDYKYPAPDFSIAKTPIKMPAQPGDLIQVQSPFRGFLKNEGGKTNMYLYREAFLHHGERTFWDRVYEYIGPKPINILATLSRGAGGLRVDRIDVSSLAGGVQTPATNPNNGGGGGDKTPPNNVNPFNLPPAPSSTDECFNKYRNYCDTIRQLQKQFCAISPDSDFCRPENKL